MRIELQQESDGTWVGKLFVHNDSQWWWERRSDSAGDVVALLDTQHIIWKDVYANAAKATSFACCQLAKRSAERCVCSCVTICPIHGDKHHGTHD